MLSGGERALTSIALIFAMSQVNPPPFIILDETDAALDEANSRRYGDMIEALAKKSQLILITHNRETMSRAGILYGITMGGDGVSKVFSVKFDEAAAVVKRAVRSPCSYAIHGRSECSVPLPDRIRRGTDIRTV